MERKNQQLGHFFCCGKDATGDREETKRCHNSGSGYGGLRVYTTLCPSLSSQNDTAAATPSGDTAQNDTPPDLRVHTVRTSLFCGRIDPQFRVSARFIVGFAIVLSLVAPLFWLHLQYGRFDSELCPW
ncbi:hypothetical protein E3N88_33167 [Mikania micrantha]|uniref:Uncharacterized protein n=1 Tax=Mikania micrantha TaxID=192012 RepID=A0A5N6MAZ3_9ASTR|nr:hypothetical protein E3N88_33167 [Mikania micrantha]